MNEINVELKSDIILFRKQINNKFSCDSDFLKVTRTLKNYCRIKIFIRKLLIKKKDKIFNSGKGKMKCFVLMTF